MVIDIRNGMIMVNNKTNCLLYGIKSIANSRSTILYGTPVEEFVVVYDGVHTDTVLRYYLKRGTSDLLEQASIADNTSHSSIDLSPDFIRYIKDMCMPVTINPTTKG